MKNLGNLVDVLKRKFERIQEMLTRTRQLENDIRKKDDLINDLRQQVSGKDDEISLLRQRLNDEASAQDEIRRLNSVIQGLRQSVTQKSKPRPRTIMTSASASKANESLSDRQGRMATVLGRMTNFLSGLSDDLVKVDNIFTVSGGFWILVQLLNGITDHIHAIELLFLCNVQYGLDQV